MSIIDLSHSIKSGDLVFEGMKMPELKSLRNVKENGFAITSIEMHSHNGTHIDAPSHMIDRAKSLSDFPVSKFYGKAIQIPCQEFVNKEIPLKYLLKYEAKIKQSEFIIFNSGWYKKWNTPDYFDHFPVLSIESAVWLSNFNLKGIGLDIISIDHIKSETVPVHLTLLNKEILIIENLNNLDQLSTEFFTFQCFPLKFDQIDGSPIRAIAMTE